MVETSSIWTSDHKFSANRCEDVSKTNLLQTRGNICGNLAVEIWNLLIFFIFTKNETLF